MWAPPWPGGKVVGLRTTLLLVAQDFPAKCVPTETSGLHLEVEAVAGPGKYGEVAVVGGCKLVMVTTIVTTHK